MFRMSNRKSAGSKRNKKHRFVPTFPSDTVSRGDGRKSNHSKRYSDVTDCYPLTKLGHNE